MKSLKQFNAVQVFNSVAGRLGLVLFSAIAGMIFFSILSIQEFNNVKHTLNLFQTEISEKISFLSKQKQDISQKKAKLSAEKQLISKKNNKISEQKRKISVKKEDMIERSFQTSQKSGIVYLLLEAIAKGEKSLWEFSAIKFSNGDTSVMMPVFKQQKTERNNLMTAFSFLGAQTDEEGKVRTEFVDYIKTGIKPILKTIIVSLLQDDFASYAANKDNITPTYQQLTSLGHKLIAIINAQTKAFDSLREELRTQENNYVKKEIELQNQENNLNKEETELQQVEKQLNQQQVAVEKESAQRLTELEEALDSSIQQIIILGIILIIMIIVAGWFISVSVTRPVNDLKKSINEIANGNGDLNRELKLSQVTELKDIAAGYNQFISKLRTMLQNIGENADKVSDASIALKEGAEQSNLVVTEQQFETNNAAIAMDDIVAEFSQISQDITLAANLSESIRQKTQHGMAKVQDTLSSMAKVVSEVDNTSGLVDSLASGIDEISAAINNINSIASQTNLLALNAAIEAARAGEHGRGFAVVADEVRSLSFNTQQATEQIEKVMEKLVKTTSQVVAAMKNSKTCVDVGQGNAEQVAVELKAVLSELDEITEITTAISHSTSTQAENTQSLNSNITEINNATSQISQLSKKTNEQSSSLASLVNNLQDLIHVFQSAKK
ncbi:methyl-accepting chemotaxis protein [sulfur-oxidizing endosymbiont of Gigantopelta aegis]|uniref:methyl-accepting chemotaxis protein n=1 Tax=sulfur-oxidizing endosymbiont of Gigantopelta aegis TaxID=2794934 RepID=UPI0018DBEC4F|nr:methyl-accepting chemotaxis protein [sulfur-oxidizing endosymbiont of Gigantopelta aegis]